MRVEFREKPWDLYISISCSILLALAAVILQISNALTILLVLFSPGYALFSSIFPARGGIRWVERLSLSFGLGVVLLVLLALFPDSKSSNIGLTELTVRAAVLTILVGLVALWRRMRLPLENRLGATFDFSSRVWHHYSAHDKALTLALVTGLALALGTIAHVLTTVQRGNGFTAFYILGPSGTTSDYPTSLKISQPGSVILGIENHESGTVSYTIRIDLVGLRFASNSTTGLNQTIEVNRTTWSWINVTRADGQNWTQPYQFSIPQAGLWEVQFILFKDGDSSAWYRELHLFVTVS